MKFLKKEWISCFLLCVIAMTGILSATPVMGTKAADMSKARTVNLKLSDNTIAGIDKPTSTDSTATSWQGDYVYFGNYENTPIKFRVLNPEETHFGGKSLFLDSDAILKKTDFGNQTPNPYDASWTNSAVRTWMNGTASGQFLNGFTENERNALLASTKEAKSGAGEYPSENYKYVAVSHDKVFALDASEANFSQYGYANDATRVKNSVDSQENIREWWLRTGHPELTDAICSVYHDGNIYNYYFPVSTYLEVGASPALNLDLEKVIFSTQYGFTKGNFASVTNATADEWKLTLQGADANLEAKVNNATSCELVSADNMSVTVTYKQASQIFDTATQTSALLTDATGTVIAYGKIGDAAGEQATIELPKTLSSGTYQLYVFAENVSGKATDYASALGTPITLTVKKTQDSTVHQVTVTNGYGSGKYEEGALVQISAEKAPSGQQFSKWEVTQGSVTLADEKNPQTTFTMGSEDVQVQAVYEEIGEAADTGEILKTVWFVLLGAAVIVTTVFYIIKKRNFQQ